MKHVVHGLVLVIFTLGSSTAASAQMTFTDPYEIYNRHLDAVGGLERLKDVKTRFFEGTLEVMGLSGTIKSWEEPPLRSRREIDLGVFTQTQGDNGQFRWMVDPNGKLQIQKDENTLEERQIEELMEAYDHVDPGSDHFTLSFEGIEKVGDIDCYVIRIGNSINDDVRLEYINTSTFQREKFVDIDPEMERYTLLSDYRDTDGIMRAFRRETEIQPIGQKQIVQVTRFETNSKIDPSIFEPPEEDVRDFEFTKGESAEDVPFRYLGDHLFIDVEIAGDKRLWALDTGAGMTVIDETYARELGLETEGKLTGVGAGHTADFTITTLPPFDIEGVHFNEQQVVVHDIAAVMRKHGVNIHGVLGYDFFSRFVTKIDYANEMLSFYLPENFQYMGDGVVLDAPLRTHAFSFPMTLDGTYTGNWILDIGAGGTVLSRGFAEEHGLLDRPGVTRMVTGAGGDFTELMSEFESLEVAGFTLSDPLISYSTQTGGVIGRMRGAGVAGNDIFRRFVLYLDYERQQVIFERGDDFGKDFPRDKSGLQLWLTDDDEIEVGFAAPGTPAEESGFEVGDIIETINGIPIDAFDGLMAVKELFQAGIGTEYSIDVARWERSKSLELVLEDLYE
jgi:hypothetical protein